VGLLVDLAQAARAVHDEQAPLLGERQYISGVDVLHVERRILAHQERVEPLQRPGPRVPVGKPPVRVVLDDETAAVTERGAVSSSDRKSTRLNSSHVKSSYAVFCLK